MSTSATPMSPILIASHAGGLRFDAQIRGHRVETDQPERGGGEDSAVMPLELLSAALGTCIALYVHRFLETRKLPTEGLRVEIGSETAQGPKRIGAFSIRVVLPEGIPEQYLPMIARVAESCPVHNTLMHPPSIEIDLEVPSLAGAA